MKSLQKPPLLDLPPDCLADPTRLDVARLEAMMLWPDDEGWRRRALETSLIEFTRPLFTVDPYGLLEQMPNFFDFSADALPINLIHKEVKKERFIRGFLSGAVLYTILRDIDSDQENASMKGAIDKCLNCLSGKTLCIGETLPKISIKTFENEIWPTFRPVSHFWAAFFKAAAFDKKQHFPCHSDDLGGFFADAESYRLVGEKARANKRSPNTVLPVGQMVSIPQNLNIKPNKLQFSYH